MLQVFGELFPYAVPVALGPLPIIVILMLLLLPGGNQRGMFFLTGRIAAVFGLTFIIALLIILLDNETGSSKSRVWLRMGLGLLLLVLAVRKAFKPKKEGEEPPGWIKAVDGATGFVAARLGVMLTLINPKEVAFAAGAGVILGAAHLSMAQSLVLAAVYSFLAAMGVIVPLTWAILAGESGKARLIPARDWLVRNQAIVVAAVLGIIGAALIGGALQEMGNYVSY